MAFDFLVGRWPSLVYSGWLIPLVIVLIVAWIVGCAGVIAFIRGATIHQTLDGPSDLEPSVPAMYTERERDNAMRAMSRGRG